MTKLEDTIKWYEERVIWTKKKCDNEVKELETHIARLKARLERQQK